VLAVALAMAAASIAYDVPEGWKSATPSSSMRFAEWELPAEGSASAEVVIFFFGEGQGGGVDANLARWYSQIEQPDGSSTKDKAKLHKRMVSDFEVTMVDMTGTYVASVRPGASERQNRPDHRMIAAVVEGDGGPWYLRVLGPEATVTKWEPSLIAFVSSFSYAP